MNTRLSSLLPALLLISLAVSAMLSTTRASACSIPVFRYALQFWQPDSFDTLVFHQGALADADKQAVQKLTDAVNESLGANVDVQTVDLNDESTSGQLRQLWEATRAASRDGAKLPHVLTLFPENYGPRGTPVRAESMNLDELRLDHWLISPARKTITERLAGGETAVWVLLEIGDEEKDTKAMKTLSSTLEKLEKSLKLPEQVPGDDLLFEPDVELKTELRIAFSTLAVARDDAPEKHFVSQLLSSEPDLLEFEEPMVFAVFGRGRTLPALVGKGINEAMIGEVAGFLVGPCSCQVKAENPGFDLLLATDWETLLQKANASLGSEVAASSKEQPVDGTPDAPPAAATIGTTAAATAIDGVDEPATAAAVTTQTAADEPPASRGGMLQSFLLVAGLGLAGLIVGTAVILKRKAAS